MRATERTVTVVIAVAGLLAAVNQITYAQNSNCPAQTVFNQCKQNEDNYLRTCKQDEYDCLCKWQKAKVSCWDTCPEDSEKESQKKLMMTYCSQPGANVTSVSSMSSMSSKTLLPIPTSSSGSASASVTPTLDTNTSAAWSIMLRNDQAIWLLAIVLIMSTTSVVL
ncbi:hypothetical protein K492DRAFT_191469 [Lichtheimia hyalospora FSU 10163]|nr:hypothetical protein K492DRAFT_191469 [Lichtheimia hyalospora FSU 10163]